jgi:hypothetical protein
MTQAFQEGNNKHEQLNALARIVAKHLTTVGPKWMTQAFQEGYNKLVGRSPPRSPAARFFFIARSKKSPRAYQLYFDTLLYLFYYGVILKRN